MTKFDPGFAHTELHGTQVYLIIDKGSRNEACTLYHEMTDMMTRAGGFQLTIPHATRPTSINKGMVLFLGCALLTVIGGLIGNVLIATIWKTCVP